MRARVRVVNYPRDLALLEVISESLPDPHDWELSQYFLLSQDNYLPPSAREVRNALEDAICADEFVFPWDHVYEKCGPEAEDSLTVLNTSPLEFAESLAPGEKVYFCGYPHESLSPLLGIGMASGFAPVPVNSGFVDAIALNASINPGNSGGPVCDVNGHVVGTVFTISNPLANADLTCFSENQQKALRSLRTNNGIAYALDTADTQGMLMAFQSSHRRVFREHRNIEPTRARVLRIDFIAFQRACIDAGVNPNGPFSFRPQEPLYSGFTDEPDRKELPIKNLEDLLKTVSWSGGSFFIMGNEILLYRQKYKGYIVPCTLDLV